MSQKAIIEINGVTLVIPCILYVTAIKKFNPMNNMQMSLKFGMPFEDEDYHLFTVAFRGNREGFRFFDHDLKILEEAKQTITSAINAYYERSSK